MDESTLIKGAQRGDLDAFNSLVTELDALNWTIHSPTLIVRAVDPLEEMSRIR